MTEERDSAVLQAFQALGPDSQDCFRMFSRSGSNLGCYVLGWWAGFIAKEYIKSSAVIKNWGAANQPVEVIVVNDTMCREIIRDCLLRRGVSVEYYERTSGGGSYTCVQRGSPGNIADFEASLFEFEEAEIQLMASGTLVLGSRVAAEGGIRVGFAALNTTLRILSFAEYLDTTQLTNLDALMANLNLKELMFCSSASGEVEEGEETLRTVKRICERGAVKLTIRSPKELRQLQTENATGHALQSLKEILRVPEERMALDGSPLAASALERLLGTVDLVDPTNHRAFYLKHVVPSTYMKLDVAAIEALHLVSRKPEPRGALPTSVFSWLNRCHTGMGARAMRQWLLQPLRSVEDINQRLTMVEMFVETPALRDAFVSQVLRRCSDMDRLNRKLQRRNIALRDTSAVLQFVGIIPAALQVLSTYRGQAAKLLMDEFIAPLEDIIEYMGNLKTLIEATVDFSDRNIPRINPAFDDELQELHTQLRTVQKEMDKEYERVLGKYDWTEKQLKHEYHATYGHVFRVSRKEDRQLRASKEFITVSTSKDGVRFVSETLSALSDKYRCINDDYDHRQKNLKTKLVETMATYLPVLDDTKEIIATLDVFVAWALVVKDSPRPMVRPLIRESTAGDGDTSPILSIKNVRHPLVELRQPHYIANSAQLTPSGNALIITGPNMGGKSTYMRSVGIAVVLAQAGCFVPADAAELQIRDAVMCRVGATDHLAQGVSTFMVEMLESAAILASATPQTLAIVDELGRGTSTFDGFGLAWAIAHEIAVRIRATLLFSTHFHELTQLPAHCPTVSNAHFGADVNEAAGTLRFSYKLEPGPCGRSYGLYVASLANLPEEVVQNAKVKAAELETFDVENTSRLELPIDSGVKAESTERIAHYAKRVRELEQSPAGEEKEQLVQRLRMEIMNDESIRPLLVR